MKNFEGIILERMARMRVVMATSKNARAIRPVMESSHQARNAFIPSIPPHQRQRVNVTFRHLI